MSIASVLRDMGKHIGKEVFVSDWTQVTQEQINQFADSTKDHQWIHVDPEKAAKGPFGKTIAHGFLTLSLLPFFSYQVPLKFEGSQMSINYGLDTTPEGRMVIRNVLPFMAFTSMLLGIFEVSGLGNVIAKSLAPMASSLPGMLLISVICALPFLSPVLGPGAVIAQVVGTLLGAQIGLGNIPPHFALPALFAINAQVGGDFVPVGLSLGEAESETIELGVPAVLYSRLITGPLAVVIAYLMSFGLYR